MEASKGAEEKWSVAHNGSNGSFGEGRDAFEPGNPWWRAVARGDEGELNGDESVLLWMVSSAWRCCESWQT